jgi:hypothetical protein
MMKRVFLITMMIAFAGIVYAQTYSYVPEMKSEIKGSAKNEKEYFEFYADHEFTVIEEQIEEIDPSLVRRHRLGEHIALYFHLMEQEYTYVTEAAPGSFSGRLVVKKPAIYNSIYRMDKYYRKLVRKGLTSEEQSINRLKESIEIALIILHKDTGEFESALEDAESDEELLTLFNRIKLNSY